MFAASRDGALASTDGTLLACCNHTAAHACTRANLSRALLGRIGSAIALSLSGGPRPSRVVVHLGEGAHGSATLLLGIVRREHSIQVLRGCARSSPMVVCALDGTFFIWELTTTARLLAASTTSGLGQ